MKPSVYIIIVNWNSKKLITECLNSLEKLNYGNCKILVVDNNSSDSAVNEIKNNFKDVNVLVLDKNYGFADGNNKGVESILNESPEYLVFLNNDTEVHPSFIEPLIAPLRYNPKIGQTAPMILYFNQKSKIWYSGGRINLWTGQIWHDGIRKIDTNQNKKIIETEYATGCCFAIRTKDFVEIGGFDSSYPMYCEDVDLSIRIRNLGQVIAVVPESKIYHKISSSLGGEFSVRKIFKKIRGYKILFWRYTNIVQKITVPFSWIIVIPYFLLKFINHKLISDD
jgi:GT2 family glycosyltransferase